MALNNVSRLILSTSSRFLGRRAFHVGAIQNGIFSKKPVVSAEVGVTGYSRIELEAAKVGEDPLETFNRDQCYTPKGSGTKSDPYIIPSRNDGRVVCVELGRDQGPPPAFWVMKDVGGRCPITGAHYKLEIIEGDKWGVDEIDLFLHH